MIPISKLTELLEELAPLTLAEPWDNVGLLLGDSNLPAARILTCLTLTPAVAQEAVASAAQLVVTHHPIPFSPLKRITTESITGRVLLKLAGANIAAYCAHTAYDSAIGGINDQWCKRLGLTRGRPLVPRPESPEVGSGRFGDLSVTTTAGELLRRAAQSVGATRPRLTGDPGRTVLRIGVACGSGGSFVAAAHAAGCDLLLTGEATFHAALEAEALGMTLAMLGHHASEWFAMVTLAERLNERLVVMRSENTPGASTDTAECWVRASSVDRDPIAVDPF